MSGLIRVNCVVLRTLLAFLTTLLVGGCSAPQLPKGMIGRIGKYDYSPSVIQAGNLRKFWWCGSARNPTLSWQVSDTILYQSVDMVTGETVGPLAVLGETEYAWDSEFTCNPKVIGGTFVNPLNDGQTYQYALYYVGIDPKTNNNIGVAFSHDGISWKKNPLPVIYASSPNGYGVGQPALYNSDQKSAITMFYEDDNGGVHHVKATSTDGVHFAIQGTITAKGLDPGCPGTWGDMAYDGKTGYWYAVFDRALRDVATTGGVFERGQLGEELYRIPDSALMSGETPWELLTVFDTTSTGFESNFIGGLVRDSYGTVNVASYPTIELYLSVSDPQPGWNASPKQAALSADPSTWDIAPAEWVPNQPLKALNRYWNGQTYVVTTGWISDFGNFQKEMMLGHLYEGPQNGATTPLYDCVRGDQDYFVSLDAGCEGERILGRNGFAYSKAIANINMIALYRCKWGGGHFVSEDPQCEGQTNDGFLGYGVP